MYTHTYMLICDKHTHMLTHMHTRPQPSRPHLWLLNALVFCSTEGAKWHAIILRHLLYSSWTLWAKLSLWAKTQIPKGTWSPRAGASSKGTEGAEQFIRQGGGICGSSKWESPSLPCPDICQILCGWSGQPDHLLLGGSRAGQMPRLFPQATPCSFLPSTHKHHHPRATWNSHPGLQAITQSWKNQLLFTNPSFT